MRLLVGTLGDLKIYKEAEYKYDSEKAIAKGSVFALCKILNPDKTVLILPESLLVTLQTKEVFECGYQSLTTKLQKEYEKELKEDPLFLGDYKGELDLWVMPSVGEFKSRTTGIVASLRGRLMDYYYRLFFETMKFLVTHVVCDNRVTELEIYLDISLGLNYTNLLTFRVLRELSRYLTLKCPVSLFVLNADPVIAGEIPSTIDFHHVFEGEKIRTAFNIENIPVDRSNPFPTKVESSKDIEISKENSERYRSWKSVEQIDIRGFYTEYVLCFLSSVKNAVPLGIFHFYPPVNEVKRLLEDSISWFAQHIELNCDEHNSLKIRRKLALSSHFRAYCISYFLGEIFKALGLGRMEEATFEHINEIAEALYSEIKIFRDRIKEELSNLRRKCKFDDYIDWRPLVFSESTSGRSTNTERNFFAHAGIAQNLVELKAISCTSCWERGEKAADVSESDVGGFTFLLRFKRDRLKDIENMLISNV